MNGFLALTDCGWYEHLSRLHATEANFRRPSVMPFRFPVGAPFLFKLKAPERAIVGFGYFAGFSVLPDWLVWETFGEANGVADLLALRQRLQTIQQAGRVEADAAGQIGCSLIAETHFLAPDAWVDPPSDWRTRTQVGATFDLTRGEGERICAECLLRAGVKPVLSEGQAPSDRFGAHVLRFPRLGQGIFRIKVLDAYQRARAVTGERSLPVLEAAQI